MIDRGNRVLPQLRLGNPGAEITRNGSHVAVQQLVPRLGERVGQLFGVVQPAPGDVRVDGALPHRHVGHKHGRFARRTAEGVGNDGVGVLRFELPGTRRTLRELPLVAVQGLQEAVVPLGRGGRPDDLEAAGDRVLANAGAKRTLPAQTLELEGAALGLGPDPVIRARAVSLAEGVATDDQRGGLLVVHRHPAEGLADVYCRGHRIRLAFWALRVHVDQTHGRRAIRVREFPFAGVALVGAQPGVLVSEQDLLGLPDVLATEGEAEGRQAHVFDGAVSGEDQKIGPGDLPAVLLLERPEQPARLVQAGVVGPAVQRGEPLRAFAATAAAIVNAVGTGGVPAHPDEQRAVVAIVGGPPVLRVRHQLEHVLLERFDVKRLDLFGVIEVVAHRVGLRCVLFENRQVHLVRPPVLVLQWGARLQLGRIDCRILAIGHNIPSGGG